MRTSKVTIEDIAGRAGVSKATVSRVLNRPTTVTEVKREAVKVAMNEMGFKPNQFARSLANGHSNTIGIVTQNIGTSFYDSIARSIIQSLRQTQYAPIFSDGMYEHDAENAAINTLLDRQVDAVIVLGGDLTPDEIHGGEDAVPMVMVARQIEGWNGVCIGVDNVAMGYNATKHLIDAGHVQIAHVTGNPSHEDAVNREKGYRKALAEANIPIDEDLIFPGNFYGQAGVLAVESWLMRGKSFSAVFAANDLSAFGVRLALSRRNIRVPDEVSIVGIDDKIESALMPPPLTTIRQPADAMGEAAVKAVTTILSGKKTESVLMQGELIVRESVSRRH
ncbi:HTH-type transcriptional regulator DegA [Rubripirellula obstinata]|uniref:HTH-type transcriptional regulator DegA n=1 Tax=Rubripirellula obstinata TaxID=406547 RepID=A0A5B1C9V3_9BACT|nr:LacI family DNA-binding transcriptional regulator [Rubripirellula obstinata]KAA1257918.1 HTH-type transcriptional regulator DegA [Rubripirellula obstinata]